MSRRCHNESTTYFESLTNDQQGWVLACFVIAVILILLLSGGIGLFFWLFSVFLLSLGTLGTVLIFAAYQIGIKKLPEKDELDENA